MILDTIDSEEVCAQVQEEHQDESTEENDQQEEENESSSIRKRSLVNVVPQPPSKEKQVNFNKRQKYEPSAKALRFLGADKEQVLRSKALKQLGLTEQDLYLAKPLFSTYEQQTRTKEIFAQRYTPKVVKITGMTEEQILRSKALRVLGITETEIENDRERRLSAFGRQEPKEKRMSSILQSCSPVSVTPVHTGAHVPKWPSKILRALRTF